MTALLPALVLAALVFGALFARGARIRASDAQAASTEPLFEVAEVAVDPSPRTRVIRLMRGMCLAAGLVAVTLGVTFFVIRPLLDQIIRFDR